MEGACVCIVELVPGLGNEIRKSSEWIDINPFVLLLICLLITFAAAG